MPTVTFIISVYEESFWEVRPRNWHLGHNAIYKRSKYPKLGSLKNPFSDESANYGTGWGRKKDGPLHKILNNLVVIWVKYNFYFFTCKTSSDRLGTKRGGKGNTILDFRITAVDVIC